MRSILLSPLMCAVGLAGAVSAQGQVFVNADISVSTTWTSNNTYNLQRQIYVLPGATLTIQPGTVIASTANVGGSLAVCRGAQIFVRGTHDRPVIMTSTADVATWTAGDPQTGTWREAANEWGNLTIMGAGYISENATPGNVPTPNANNVATMEGLVANPLFPTRVLYGGGNDNDDSGEIRYLSIRYGGKVIGLNNELNGLSLGGIGRETDIHHVEIMNNVDDGIEIWGGTVNLQYFSIWNVGDDSFDVDQGWRGKAQFGLIVQGYSVDASQGSGFGDNAFEIDGAEDSDWLPVTTTSIYNCTVVGNPTPDGDHATAWRDNARVQYRNCIFMDIGDRVVSFDNLDGDGAQGYGFNGTLSWPATWTTPATNNPPLYTSQQTNGNLAEIKDSVFFNNNSANAYTEANARGVFAPANNNVMATASPIQAITRAPRKILANAGLAVDEVTFLDPRPANDALNAVSYAPALDSFFSSANYRGAFVPGANWLYGWTASTAFGFTPDEPWTDLGNALAGSAGDPELSGTGSLVAGTSTTIKLSNAVPNSGAVFLLSGLRNDFDIFGGTVVPDLASVIVGGPYPTNANGEHSFTLSWPNGFVPGVNLYMQYWVFDPTGPQMFFAASNAIVATTP